MTTGHAPPLASCQRRLPPSAAQRRAKASVCVHRSRETPLSACKLANARNCGSRAHCASSTRHSASAAGLSSVRVPALPHACAKRYSSENSLERAAEAVDAEADNFVDPDLQLGQKRSTSQAVEEGEAGRDSPQGVGTFDVLSAVDKRGDRGRGFDVKKNLQEY